MNIFLLGFYELKITEIEEKYLEEIKNFCNIFHSTVTVRELSKGLLVESNSTEHLYVFLYNLTLHCQSITITLN